MDKYTKFILTMIAVGILGLNYHLFKGEIISKAYAEDTKLELADYTKKMFHHLRENQLIHFNWHMDTARAMEKYFEKATKDKVQKIAVCNESGSKCADILTAENYKLKVDIFATGRF